MTTEYFTYIDDYEDEEQTYLVKGFKPTKDTISKKATRMIMNKPLKNNKNKSFDRNDTLRRKEYE